MLFYLFLSRQSVVILGGKGKNVMLFDPKHVFQNKEQLTILSERFKTDIYLEYLRI